MPALRRLPSEVQPHACSGELAQLGERLVCNQEVTGSSPVFSTNLRSQPGAEEASLAAQRACRPYGEGSFEFTGRDSRAGVSSAEATRVELEDLGRANGAGRWAP